MATITRTFVFVPDTDARASEVNTEFNTILSFLNNDVSHVDGSKAYTGIPLLPASDPTNDNHAVRKLYVDSAWTDITASCTFGAFYNANVSKQVYAKEQGKTRHVRGTVVLTGAPAVGNMQIELPAGYGMKAETFNAWATGVAMAVDNSSSVHHAVVVRINDDSGNAKTMTFVADGGNSTLTNAVPFTWTTGDVFSFQITYETA